MCCFLATHRCRKALTQIKIIKAVSLSPTSVGSTPRAVPVRSIDTGPWLRSVATGGRPRTRRDPWDGVTAARHGAPRRVEGWRSAGEGECGPVRAAGGRPGHPVAGTAGPGAPPAMTADSVPYADEPAAVGRSEPAPAVSWAEARRRAGTATGRLPAEVVALAEAGGLVLTEPLRARCDLPPFDTCAMDGWAVRGQGPWTVSGEWPAGSVAPPLRPGQAAGVATGSRLPEHATAVLRAEYGFVAGGVLHRLGDRDTSGARCAPDPDHQHDQHHQHDQNDQRVEHGREVRPRGQECRAGDVLVPSGAPITPAVLGLAAAAGNDALPAVPRPRVDLLLLGDELLRQGLPRDGLVRDALGPMLPGWLRALGGRPGRPAHVADSRAALAHAVAQCRSEMVVTTGGTARGELDHLHTVLDEAGAELLVDGVAVRPGHPMLLARLPGGRILVGLPGNPLAAVAGLLTLVEPVLRTLAGRPGADSCRVRLDEAVAAPGQSTRLVPIRAGQVLPHGGPAMLRGLVQADALAVIPPGGVARASVVESLPLPENPL
jgi:molybdopterin molybdotransferase